MKVLVIGSGGREHALAWKLVESQRIQKVYVAPGNGGTAQDQRLENVGINPLDVKAVCDWVAANNIGFTVIGPEAPLAAGLSDALRAAGHKVFGPTQAAARIESSKAFAKDFMKRHGIPTAAYDTFSDAGLAHAHVDKHGAPIVIKADGLAAGKGVVVAMTLEQAHQAIDWMLVDNTLGVSHNTDGARVVIEEFMTGEEASFIVISDGQTVLPLATSQDHKRLLDGDAGPNTGGMGAYSPAPVVTPAVHARAMREVILPTLKGMQADGHPFAGFLYAGLMIAVDGSVKVVEFNARLGDPEAEVILPRLKSDLLDTLLAAADGKLQGVELDWDRRTALGVIIAAQGYPMNPRKGDAITGIGAAIEDAMVFHCGTVLKDGVLSATGGRVLCAVALADSVKVAQSKALAMAQAVNMAGKQFRSDIGYRAIKKH